MIIDIDIKIEYAYKIIYGSGQFSLEPRFCHRRGRTLSVALHCGEVDPTSSVCVAPEDVSAPCRNMKNKNNIVIILKPHPLNTSQRNPSETLHFSNIQFCFMSRVRTDDRYNLSAKCLHASVNIDANTIAVVENNCIQD